MKELPILMSTPMVQAILEGRKTQTRRILKSGTPLGNFDETLKKCPYGTVGDILWVRETHAIWNNEVLYKADASLLFAGGIFATWKPSIFMKREHSRISLLVKNIRIERLQDISESDAIAEGITPYAYGYFKNYLSAFSGGRPKTGIDFKNPIDSYKSLWESINGVGSWEDNPLVWVVEFEKM